jgi:PIN domain nuclease of toxin-antitoxin system
VRLLLDTPVFIWWRENNPRLKEGARSAIAGPDVVLVSAATAWEIAIKTAIGKLRVPGPVEPAVEDSGFGKLAVDFRHAAAVATLPPHHSDPFDRMLLAQALVEGLTLVTHDRRFERYRVPMLWA